MSSKILTNVTLVQKCFLIKAGNVLALKRPSTDRSRPGCWDTPGGGYEAGENVLYSITREVKEEAGVTINNPRPIYFANQIGAKSGLYYGDHVFAVCYVCDRWEGLSTEASAKVEEITLSDEHVEYRWVTPQEFMTLDFGEDGGFFVASMSAYLDSLNTSK